MHRGLSTKAGANVLQPAEEAPLIEWGVRQNVSLLTVMHRSSGSAEQWGSSKSQSGACRRLARPEGPCLLLSGPTTARPARCSCGRGGVTLERVLYRLLEGHRTPICAPLRRPPHPFGSVRRPPCSR